MIPQSYKFSHDLCLNNSLQVRFIDNQVDQVPPFRCINWDDKVSILVRGRKVLGDTKQLMRSVKRAAEAVGNWNDDNWEVKRVN